MNEKGAHIKSETSELKNPQTLKVQPSSSEINNNQELNNSKNKK